MDILYFLLSSLRAEILAAKFDELFEHYYKSLVEACELLGVANQAPSFEAFSLQLKKNAHYGYMILPQVVPAVVMERNENANIAAFLGDPESEAAQNLATKMFKNPKYIEILKHVIPFMDKKGYLVKYEEPKEIKQLAESVKEASIQPPVVIEEIPVPVEEPKPEPVSVPVEEQKPEPVAIQSATVEEITPVEPEASSPPPTPTTPTVVVEPWQGQDAKPKRLLKARIEETINKFAALEGQSKFRPDTRVCEFPAGYPKWLDKFYFTDLLRRDYNSFKIYKFSVGPANGKGENYASQMFRVKISVESNNALINRNFMVKVNHDTGPVAEMMKMVPLFPKEIEMYTKFLPKFESMYRAVGEDVRMSAKCILGTRDPADLIILEDLSLGGFKTADRFNGLDLDHVHLTIDRLAKLHAASAVYVQEGGTYDTKFDEGMYSKAMIPIMENLHQGNIDVMKVAMKSASCSKTLNHYFENWKELFFNHTIPDHERVDSRFNVLCHGDMWCNNIMFKYNACGSVEDCVLVDFQICQYNTPMIDLHYFIVSSLHNDIRVSKIDYVISYYHCELVKNLKKLGYKKPMPTLLQFQKDFLATGSYGLATAFGTLAIALCPPSEDADLSSFLGDSAAANNFKMGMYGNPGYLKALEELVPYFERKGYFEL